jgi:hypothetical protein
MGDSIVDLGAAAADYVGDALSGAYDYLTGTPEASASGGYYKKLGPGSRQYYPGPGDYKKSNPVMEYFGFGGGGVVSLGAGDPGYIDMGDMSMNEGFGLSRDDPAYMQESGFSGPAYAEDQTRPADLSGPFFEEYNPVDGEYKRLEYYDMYQDFAPSVTGLRPEDLESGQADEMLDIKGFRGAKKRYLQEGGLASLGKTEDTTGPDTMQPIPQYPGIEGFDIYKDLAPEQFKRRPIDKQMFDKKRGFQFGQMVELRNEAVGGKLLKQAGIQAPLKQVLANLDPKVMEQVSTILGREVV